MKAHNKSNERLVGERDIIHIAILVAIALVIGIYLIATTVLIAKDGVSYIERAQQFPSDPVSIIKTHPPEYPFLIFITHKLVSLFRNSSSIQDWIYAAQGITLLCRLLALIPLYYIGKLLVGSKNSFWAILILIFLPYPTRIVCDVVREWPYLLFLATGFFFLLWGAKYGKWWALGLAGLSSGLGYLIRPESAQLVVYGFLWVALSVFRPKLGGVSRWKTVFALVLLIIGFAVPTVPYMRCTGKIIPPKINSIIKSFSFNPLPHKMNVPKIISADSNCNTAEMIPHNVLKAIGEIIETIGENLMWFFIPTLCIGFYCHFRQKAEYEERFLIGAFILMNVVMVILRYCFISQRTSQRWTLPLVAFTVFYIPVGLQVVGNWLNNKRSHPKQKKKRLSWFVILFLIGIGICMPKLLRPVRIEKQGYRRAAKWLRENTTPTDIVAVPDDKRITFYAQRQAKKMQVGTNTLSGRGVTPGNWCHLVGTYDGKYQKLYINGKLVSSTEPGLGLLNAGRDDLAIGKPYAEHKSYFKGLIKDVRIYSKALSGEDIEALCNQQIPEVENGVLIGYWPLEGDTPDVNVLSGGGMAFDGIKDYIDLSGFGTRLNADKLTVSVSVKPEILKRMNWILGNGAQFRIGIRNSKVYFWIRERPPGKKIPAKAAYVVAFVKEGSTELEMSFNKRVQEKYSVWVNKREKKKRIVIYEVL